MALTGGKHLVSPEAWQQVKALVDACLDLPLSERAKHLHDNCSDLEVRREVLSLLAAYEESEEFLDDPSAIAEDMAAVSGISTSGGQRVGSYRLMEEIGRGGMGTVYRAIRSDDAFQIEVALKVVRHGMDTEMVLRRFLVERQILASLEHPYIARILDGGTTADGLPYLVMEYVKGVSLAKYCDQQRLSIPERLELFRKVCEAVSYAHQNLVVHRDLKPGNILITAEGKPKLLDFGIAKILSEGIQDLDATHTGYRLATPAYASPEQIRGGLTGVSSDVYSLGVLLYELLTGHPPYRLSAGDSERLAQVICEREPTRASAVVSFREAFSSQGEPIEIDPAEISRRRKTTLDALIRRLRGDLDNILAMALRKETQRRYSSVEQLSEDIRRHLEGMPVIARKDTVRYRASKFIRRHRVGLAASVAVAIALCTTTTLAIWKAQKLYDRIDQDQKLASLFLVEVHDQIAKLPGSTPAREVLLGQSLKFLNGLESEAGNDPAMRRALALAHERFAELQAGAIGGGLGQSHRALETYEKAQVLREGLAAEFANDAAIQFDLAKSYQLAGVITGRSGKADKRLEYERKAMSLLEKLNAADPKDRRYVPVLARSHSSYGYALNHYDRWTEARRHFLKALELRLNLKANSPYDSAAERDTAEIYYRLGVSHTQSREFSAALGYLKEAFKGQSQLLAKKTDDGQLRSDLASTQHFLSVTYRNLSRLPEALVEIQAAIAIREAMLAEDQRDARTRSLLAGNYAERGSVLLASKQLRSALVSTTKAVALQREVLDLDSAGVPVRINMAEFTRRAAGIHDVLANSPNLSVNDRMEHREAARKLYRDAVRFYDELESGGHIQSQSVARSAADARRGASLAIQQANAK